MQKFFSGVLFSAAVVGAMFSVTSSEVQARPNYLGAFKGQYAGLATQVEEAKCGVCHYDQGDKKKLRNDYGKAVGEALGGPKVTDAEKIKEALVKSEKGKSSVEGKTFGDLIKDGKLPGKNP